MRLGSARTVGAALVAVTAIIGSQLSADPAGAATTPAPSVGSVKLSTGSTSGGTRITIVGTHFTSVRSVKFGKSAGRSLHVLSSTKLQVTTPAHSAGTVDVRVQTKTGLSRTHSTDHFKYVAPPSVSSVSPKTGPMTGATRVTVTGSGFSKVTSVLFGSSAGKSLHVLSSTKLQVTAPAHSVGTIDVRVSNSFGRSAVKTVDHFGYHTVVHVSPAVVGAGATMTVSGSGYRKSSAVTVVLDSDITPLGTTQVTAAGTFSASFVMATGLANGTHQVIAVGADTNSVSTRTPVAVFVDAAAPVVTDVVVPSATVSAGDTITVSAHVTDVSGVGFIALDVEPEGGGAVVCVSPKNPKLASGTRTNGVWSMDCQIPADAVSGTYEVVPWGADVYQDPETGEFYNYVNVNDGPPAPQPTFTVNGAP